MWHDEYDEKPHGIPVVAVMAAAMVKRAPKQTLPLRRPQATVTNQDLRGGALLDERNFLPLRSKRPEVPGLATPWPYCTFGAVLLRLTWRPREVAQGRSGHSAPWLGLFKESAASDEASKPSCGHRKPKRGVPEPVVGVEAACYLHLEAILKTVDVHAKDSVAPRNFGIL